MGYVTFGTSCPLMTLHTNRLRLMFTPSPLSEALHKPKHHGIYYLAYSAIPRLPPLPHQVQQSLHAFTHEIPRIGIPESAQPRENGTSRGEKDCQVC